MEKEEEKDNYQQEKAPKVVGLIKDELGGKKITKLATDQKIIYLRFKNNEY